MFSLIQEKSPLIDVYLVKLILIVKALAGTKVTMPSSAPYSTSPKGLGARPSPRDLCTLCA